jgi:putative acetyltransferase
MFHAVQLNGFILRTSLTTGSMTASHAVHVRAAEQIDVDALTAMANLPGVRRGTMRLPYTPRALFERRVSANAGHHLLVGTIKNDGGVHQVVAHGSLMPRGGRMAHVGEVLLFVHDDHTRQGYGDAILRALVDLADNWLGLRRLELDVNTDNVSAIRLYERHGFVVEGTKRSDVLRAGVLVDFHVMGRLRAAAERMVDGSGPEKETPR